jgi:dienelactone hydrolase
MVLPGITTFAHRGIYNSIVCIVYILLSGTAIGQSGAEYQTVGVQDSLPVFRDKLEARTTHSWSWTSGNFRDFGLWKELGRKKVQESLFLLPPAVAFNPVVLAEQDRGTHIAKKVVLNITGDSHVLGYYLVPKGSGPFPAVLLLHDHSGKFDIGKEKVVQPFDEPEARIQSADAFVNKSYSGRYIGDELAKRGYACFVTDALNWGDRGGAEAKGQALLNRNLMHYGMSLTGVIAHEDVRAAEFLASQPEVDENLVAAMGLSMGSFRTWQVAALSDHISAGVAICWMTSMTGQIMPGLNAVKGSSKYTMLHPGVYPLLDYADIAGLACPKPMLFYNGLQDKLFPIPTVKSAYEKLHNIWRSQGMEDRLETRLWDVPHTFNLEMQETAFDWLDQQIVKLQPADKSKTKAYLRLPSASGSTGRDYQQVGVVQNYPVFLDKLAERTTFPLSWLSGNFTNFYQWRQVARDKVTDCLYQPPPPTPFDVKILDMEDRGTYVAQKLALNISGDSRVAAYMTIPKGPGPFPAVLLLHDHSGVLEIGKEKMIRPLNVTGEKMQFVEKFVGRAYEGRYVGDELAKRGYICFITDALSWGERGGTHELGLQAINSNLMHYGMSLSGLYAYEDMRAAEFLAQHTQVDPTRIGAMGLSMGAYRTWQVAALSPHIAAGAAICWMSTVKDLMRPEGRSACGYTMMHAGLYDEMDYPDVASIACPKPMLFYNGSRDHLFSVASVNDAYTKMRAIWESQGASDKLETRLWDVPHTFNQAMQEAAFDWMDRQLQ